MRPALLALAILCTAACSSPPPATSAPPATQAPKTEPAPAATPAGRYREASIEDLEKALPAVKLLDVRSPGEFESGHVAGARLIPVGDLPNRLSELDAWKGEEVWVICQSGGRSAKAGQLLAGEGFQVVNVRGGTGAWIAAGKPVE
jgi:rhodanese-related sulfurtransferase